MRMREQETDKISLGAAGLQLQSVCVDGGVVITSTGPPFPPCGRLLQTTSLTRKTLLVC